MKEWQYVVLDHYDREELEQSVDEFLDEGWVTAGGVSAVCDSDSDILYLQALVKRS